MIDTAKIKVTIDKEFSSLIPAMANPKDLFSLVRPSAVASDAGTKMSRVA